MANNMRTRTAGTFTDADTVKTLDFNFDQLIIF